jgi:hypothetical protein
MMLIVNIIVVFYKYTYGIKINKTDLKLLKIYYENNLLTLATITLDFSLTAIAQTSDTETVNAGATLIKPMILQVQNGTSGINFGTINIIEELFLAGWTPKRWYASA